MHSQFTPRSFHSSTLSSTSARVALHVESSSTCSARQEAARDSRGTQRAGALPSRTGALYQAAPKLHFQAAEAVLQTFLCPFRTPGLAGARLTPSRKLPLQLTMHQQLPGHVPTCLAALKMQYFR